MEEQLSIYVAAFQKCAAVCEQCATLCLLEKAIQSMSRCIALDRQCFGLFGYSHPHEYGRRIRNPP